MTLPGENGFGRMRNPCRWDCPDRTPGCNCEKRQAWLWLREQAKQSRRREDILDAYQKDAVRKSERSRRK